MCPKTVSTLLAPTGWLLLDVQVIGKEASLLSNLHPAFEVGVRPLRMERGQNAILRPRRSIALLVHEAVRRAATPEASGTWSPASPNHKATQGAAERARLVQLWPPGSATEGNQSTTFLTMKR